MPQTTKFSRPDLGDVFVRRNLNGNDEEAMILCVQTKPNGQLWQAVMSTKNGTEFVTGDAEFRNIHDWRPKGWLYDETTGAWFSPADKAKLDTERAAAAEGAHPEDRQLRVHDQAHAGDDCRADHLRARPADHA